MPGPYENSEMILSMKSLESCLVKFPKQDFTRTQANICKTIDMNQAYEARIHLGVSLRLLTRIIPPPKISKAKAPIIQIRAV